MSQLFIRYGDQLGALVLSLITLASCSFITMVTNFIIYIILHFIHKYGQAKLQFLDMHSSFLPFYRFIEGGSLLSVIVSAVICIIICVCIDNVLRSSISSEVTLKHFMAMKGGATLRGISRKRFGITRDNSSMSCRVVCMCIYIVIVSITVAIYIILLVLIKIRVLNKIQNNSSTLSLTSILTSIAYTIFVQFGRGTIYLQNRFINKFKKNITYNIVFSNTYFIVRCIMFFVMEYYALSPDNKCGIKVLGNDMFNTGITNAGINILIDIMRIILLKFVFRRNINSSNDISGYIFEICFAQFLCVLTSIFLLLGPIVGVTNFVLILIMLFVKIYTFYNHKERISGGAKPVLIAIAVCNILIVCTGIVALCIMFRFKNNTFINCEIFDSHDM